MISTSSLYLWLHLLICFLVVVWNVLKISSKLLSNLINMVFLSKKNIQFTCTKRMIIDKRMKTGKFCNYFFFLNIDIKS